MRALDYFENILPEGQALTRAAALAGVRPADTYGILAMFGRDCAGAVMLLPEGEHPRTGSDSGYLPATEDDLVRLISSLDTAPLAVALERGFRPSLAGFQRKALVARADDGTQRLTRKTPLSRRGSVNSGRWRRRRCPPPTAEWSTRHPEPSG